MVEVRKQASSSSMLSKSGGSSGKKAFDVRSALSEQNKMGDLISDLGENLQQERIEDATVKLEAFQKFRQEIGIAVCKAQLGLNDIRKRLKENIYTE